MKTALLRLHDAGKAKRRSAFITWMIIGCTSLVLSACMGNPAIQESQRLAATGQTEAALSHLRKAMEAAPQDVELRSTYYRQRELALQEQFAIAMRALNTGDAAGAESRLRLILRLDPNNVRAQHVLHDIVSAQGRAQRVADAEKLFVKNDLSGSESMVRSVLAETPSYPEARSLLRKIEEAIRHKQLDAPAGTNQKISSKQINLEFRDAQLRSVFEVIARTAGINFVFDRDIRADATVTVFARDTTIGEAMRLVLATNQLASKSLNENSILIYPDNPAKRREYEDLVTRTFYLSYADVKQAQSLVQKVVKSKDIFIDEKLNLLIVKDTPQAIRLAEQLIESLDVADPEVMLDVEVLEISRNKMLELGLRFPDMIGYGRLTPDVVSTTTNTNGDILGTTTTFGGELTPGNLPLKRGISSLVPYVGNPGLLLNLKDQDGDSNILANPRIRVRNREKAKIHIGDKLPVFTTTTTANVGVSASVNYLDVGLKLDVEPTIQLADEVLIRIGLEVSSIAREISGPNSSLAYQIGTRATNTVLQLRDGETQVLAGLISDEERSSANRLPGIGELPVIGRLFSTKRNSANKTEIVLLITPHILRNIVRPSLASAMRAAGTEADIGSPIIYNTPNTSNATIQDKSVQQRVTSSGEVVVQSRPRIGQNFNNQESASDADVNEVGPNGELLSSVVTEAGAPHKSSNRSAAPYSRNASSASVAANAPLKVRLDTPTQVVQGETFVVGVSVEATGAQKGGEVSIAYDANFFEAVEPAASGGTLQVPLNGGDGAASSTFVLRAKAGFNGIGKVSVISGRLMPAVGAAKPLISGAAQDIVIK